MKENEVRGREGTSETDMVPDRFESAELDRDSIEYLHTVRESRGRGIPGILIRESGSSLAGWGAGLGVLLLLTTPLFLYGLLWRNSFNLAMLLTGLGFLGAWLIVAWIRQFIGRRSSRYLGHFKYVDPLHLWQATGSGVWVTPLTGLLEARCKHEYSGSGGYSRSTIHVVLERGAFDFTVYSERGAEAIESYLNEITRDRSGLPIEHGYEAVRQVRSRDDEDEARKPIVESIPKPHKERASIVRLVRYPAVAILFVLAFFVSYLVCRLGKDITMAWAVQGKAPPALRVYIADRSNLLSRESIIRELKTHHETLAGNVERQPGEPDLTKGLADLIRFVHDQPTPVITIGFKRDPEKKPASVMEEVLGPHEGRTLALRSIRRFSETSLPTWLKPQATHQSAHIGDSIVAFGQVEDDSAMILIEPKLISLDKNRYRVVWTLTIKAPTNGRIGTLLDEKKTVKWQEDFTAANEGDKAARFREIGERFPDRFMQYLQQKIPDQIRP